MEIKQILERARKLDLRYYSFFGQLRGTSGWSGIVNDLGSSTVYNTPLARAQFIFTLAMSGHSLIDRLSREEGVEEEESINMQQLVDNEVLKNKRILDLGCGYVPSFARLTRWLGANTYTVDVIPAEEFKYNPIGYGGIRIEFPDWMKEAENKQHIRLDLSCSDALENLLNRTGGNFDLVTEAHLHSVSYYERWRVPIAKDPFKMAESLLKDGGIFYPSEGISECYLKNNEGLRFITDGQDT